MTSQKKFFTTYNMALIAISAALITICSWISFNFGDVPFTLQTFAVFTILMTIGGKRGTVAIVLYLLMGLTGLPVFANFKGGAQALTGPTGGFLVGFIAMGLLYFVLADVLLVRFKKLTDKKPFLFAARIVICVICSILLYAFGTVWFVNIYAGDSGKVGYATALSWCVTPFLLPDFAKIVLATVVADRVAFTIKK